LPSLGLDGLGLVAMEGMASQGLAGVMNVLLRATGDCGLGGLLRLRVIWGLREDGLGGVDMRASGQDMFAVASFASLERKQ